MKIDIEKIKSAAAEVAATTWNYNKELMYLFSQKMINNNPSYFFKKEDGTYLFADGTKVGILPDIMSLSDDGKELCYIIPIDNNKPLKFCFEGDKDEIFDCFDW